MNYEFLHQHLRQKGFIVYPHEIVCGSEGCQHDQNRFVDVAARKDGALYAFEYKSSADRLLRAVKQVDNYSKSFDFVIVVAEVPRSDISINPKRGVRIKEILAQGAGLWTVQFIRSKNLWQKADLAKCLIKISKVAPIEAHEVNTESTGRLRTQEDKWFWLFYSVMDRRSNAATFINAKEILKKARLFSPVQITRAVRDLGKDKTIHKITSTLTGNCFAPLKDRTMGVLAQPRSIVEAALFMAKYDFNFTNLYLAFFEKASSRAQACEMLWKALQDIYGVGPRIASQFIRGMVLKGGWDFPLIDDRYLEECDFNVQIAQKMGLVQDKAQFRTELGKFADTYLEGNRGILSHVIWYIRKRYCHPNLSKALCAECPVFEHCYDNTLQWRFTEIIQPTRQQPSSANREWVEKKMLRESTHIVTMRKPPHPSQSKLSTFISS